MPPVNVLLPLLIVAIAPDPPIEARYPEAVTVFHCTFDASWDKNFDQWPDGWTRRQGQGFPHYVSIKTAKYPSPQDDRCLRIDLDGGAAAAYSPPIEVDSLFGYVLEGYLKTEGLDHDRAYFSVTLLDAQRHRLETFYSEKVRQTPGWKKLRLGPISPGSADARLAIIGLHVQPQSREDLKGTVWFDDIWLGRLPRLALTTTGAYNLFDQAEQVEVNCVVSGFVDGDSGRSVTLQLEDVLGHELTRVERRLGTLPADPSAAASPSDGGRQKADGERGKAAGVRRTGGGGLGTSGSDIGAYPTHPATSAFAFHLEPVAFRVEPAAMRLEPAAVPSQPAALRFEAPTFRAEPATLPSEPAALIGKAAWHPPLPGPGFYLVRATLKGRRGLVLRQELSLAVFDQQETPAAGEFGWTLPRGDQPLPLTMLSRLICQAGINWVKYPLWYDPQRGDELIEDLVTFGERLGQHGIALVGLLQSPSAGAWGDPSASGSPPPGPAVGGPYGPLQETSEQYPAEGRVTAAAVFAADPKSWYLSLEPVMARLATRVRWWQLGDDKDTSFVDCPNLAGKIARVKAELDRIGRDVNLGLAWSWINELPQAAEGKAPWRFVSLSADPPMTPLELATYLDASQKAKLRRWVVIEPLPKDDYPVEVRATDLLRRMIAAKIHGADAAFCPDPFSTQRGLMNDDGTPGELLFTWRTVARTLGGATYLGSIQLPQGSPNQIFARGDDMVMVVWNDKPTEEIIYLGEDVRQIDLWGRSIRPAEQGHRQVIRVGRLPTLVTGIHGAITRWRLDFSLGQERIPSISNRPHPESFRLQNHFARGVVGRATLVAPEDWKLSPRQTTFWLGDGEQFSQDFGITLPQNASSGRQPLRVDFEVEAERSYRFSVYRHIDVGLGDVYIEIATRLNDQGELEVEQRLINRSDGPVSFRCQLFAPQRRRLYTQIIGLRPGRDEQIYRLPDGKDLLGQTLWLRADEIGGPRVLNYRFPAKR
jgi:hypothetical protein